MQKTAILFIKCIQAIYTVYVGWIHCVFSLHTLCIQAKYTFNICHPLSVILFFTHSGWHTTFKIHVKTWCPTVF